jgi:Domain of unknown function (DUF4352)
MIHAVPRSCVLAYRTIVRMMSNGTGSNGCATLSLPYWYYVSTIPQPNYATVQCIERYLYKQTRGIIMQQPPDNGQPYPSQPPFQQQPIPPFQQYPQQPPPGYQFQPPQGPYYQPPKKSHKGLWIALAIGLVVVIALCSIVSIAASGASKTAVTTDATSAVTQTTTDTSSSSSSLPSGNTVVSLGKSIVVDAVSCTATSAKVLPAGQYDQPKQGQEYIVVHVKMSNDGQSDQTYSPFDFHVKSSAGNVTNYTFTSSYTANNTLDSGTMAPGGKVEGDLVFEIPVDDSKAELTWTPSFFNTSTQYAWVLNVK